MTYINGDIKRENHHRTIISSHYSHKWSRIIQCKCNFRITQKCVFIVEHLYLTIVYFIVFSQVLYIESQRIAALIICIKSRSCIIVNRSKQKKNQQKNRQFEDIYTYNHMFNIQSTVLNVYRNTFLYKQIHDRTFTQI